jgi:hypothetical protein
LLAAICEALDLPLPDLLVEVAETMRPVNGADGVRPLGSRQAELRRAAPTAGPASASASALVSIAA